MRKISLLFLLITPLIAAKANCKKITPHTQKLYLFHINKALLYSADSMYQKACEEFEIAFKYRNDYAPALFECARTYDRLNDTLNTLKYARLCCEDGYDWYTIPDYLPNLRKTKQFPSPDQLAQYKKTFFEKVNMDYLKQLDSLVAADQRVRRSGMSTGKDITTIDSIDMGILKTLIEKYGYPKYSNVGYKGETDVFVLLLHGLMDGLHDSLNWAYYQPIILKEIKKGNLMPDHYALLYDRIFSDYRRKEQYYGMQYSATGIVPIYDIANVDIRRKKIGLPCLADQLKFSHTPIPEGYVRK